MSRALDDLRIEFERALAALTERTLLNEAHIVQLQKAAPRARKADASSNKSDECVKRLIALEARVEGLAQAIAVSAMGRRDDAERKRERSFDITKSLLETYRKDVEALNQRLQMLVRLLKELHGAMLSSNLAAREAILHQNKLDAEVAGLSLVA